MPVVRTDGRSFGRSVYGHVIIEFSGMSRFTYPWCSAGARFARARAPLYKDSWNSESWRTELQKMDDDIFIRFLCLRPPRLANGRTS